MIVSIPEKLVNIYKKFDCQLFTILSLFLCLLLIISKPILQNYFYIPIAVVSYIVIFLIVRVLLREAVNLSNDLKNLKYVKLDDFEEDSKKQMELAYKSSFIYIGIILMVIPVVKMLNFSTETHKKIVVYLVALIIAIFILYFTQIFVGKYQTTFLILASTFIGFIFIIVTLFNILFSFISVIASIFSRQPSPDLSFLSIYKDLGQAALNLSGDYSYFWVNLFFSFLIQYIIIRRRPPYMVSNIKYAYKTVSFIFTTTTLLLFFFSNESYKVFSDFAKSVTSDASVPKVVFDQLSTSVYSKDFFDKFIKGLTLPYTLASLIGLYALDIKESKNSSKAHKGFLKALHLVKTEQPKEQVLQLLKEAIYYGGAAYINQILACDKFDIYRDDLDYKSMVTKLEKVPKVSKVNETLKKFKNQLSTALEKGCTFIKSLAQRALNFLWSIIVWVLCIAPLLRHELTHAYVIRKVSNKSIAPFIVLGKKASESDIMLNDAQWSSLKKRKLFGTDVYFDPDYLKKPYGFADIYPTTDLTVEQVKKCVMAAPRLEMTLFVLGIILFIAGTIMLFAYPAMLKISIIVFFIGIIGVYNNPFGKSYRSYNVKGTDYYTYRRPGYYYTRGQIKVFEISRYAGKATRIIIRNVRPVKGSFNISILKTYSSRKKEEKENALKG